MCLTKAKDEDDVVGADKAICFVRLGQGSRLSLNVASRKIKIKTRLFPLPPPSPSSLLLPIFPIPLSHSLLLFKCFLHMSSCQCLSI